MDSDSDDSTYCSEEEILERNTEAEEVEEEEIDYNVYNNGITSLKCIFSAYSIVVVGFFIYIFMTLPSQAR
jgi:hypothetical protein